MERTLGDWRVVADMTIDYVEAQSEDGPYTKEVESPSLIAEHVRGRLFCFPVMSLEEAENRLQALPQEFAPDDQWFYLRTRYGSEDWSSDDELAMMDPEERQSKGLA